MSEPRISVLIPTYNAARFLGKALDSVFSQTYQNFEVIIVDDGSTDDTGHVVAKYPQVRYRQCPHRGISATRNECLTMATGEWLAFLDADDLWHPEKLQKQMSYLEAHPSCQILFTEVQVFFDGDPAAITPRQQQELSSKMLDVLPSALFHRSLYTTYGGFLTHYDWGEDTEWIIRLRTASVDLNHCLPEALYLRRIHDSNITLTHPKRNPAVIRQIFLSAMRSRVLRDRKRKSETENPDQ